MRKSLKLLPVLVLVALGLVPLTPGSAGSGLTFGDVVIVSHNDTNETGSEPSIRSAPDGTLYIVAPQGLLSKNPDNSEGGGDVIWRSDDGGKTWKFLGSLDNQQGGGDADVAPDAKGNVWGSGLTLANTTSAFSEDRGQSFQTNLVGTLDTVVDRQWIETYKDKPYVFLTTGDIKERNILLSKIRRLPTGQPAPPEQTVTVSGDDPYQWPGEIAVDEKNGFVYVAYNTDDDSVVHDKIMVARTDLNLENQKLFKVAVTKGDSFDSFVGIDVDKAGNVYTVWTERRPREVEKFGRTGSYVASSRDNGKTWGKPVKVNSRARTTTFPWLVAGSGGRVGVAYYGINHRGPSPEDVVIDGRRVPKWKIWVSYSLNGAGKDPSYIEKRATGIMHVGNICTSGTGCSPGTRDLADFFQLDLNPCGRIVITYTDNSRDTVDESSGERTSNKQELIAFVKQSGGPKFYKSPPPAGAKC